MWKWLKIKCCSGEGQAFPVPSSSTKKVKKRIDCSVGNIHAAKKIYQGIERSKSTIEQNTESILEASGEIGKIEGNLSKIETRCMNLLQENEILRMKDKAFRIYANKTLDAAGIIKKTGQVGQHIAYNLARNLEVLGNLTISDNIDEKMIGEFARKAGESEEELKQSLIETGALPPLSKQWSSEQFQQKPRSNSSFLFKGKSASGSSRSSLASSAGRERFFSVGGNCIGSRPGFYSFTK